MKKIDLKTVVQREVVAITCDKCKTEIASDNFEEFQEIQTFYVCGGFFSILGDGTEYELDLCQHCFKEVLGSYLRPINLVE